jgi:endonuclease/exonuclease/phosphatase family metal-dependent hydrolase
MESLKVVSFNCQSVRKNAEIVKCLMLSHDIVLLQETLLTDTDLNFCADLNNDFDYAATPSSQNLFAEYQGRPSGGLVILWRKKISFFVYPILISKRIMCLNLVIADKTYHLINVYMPCDYRNQESLLCYQNILAELAEFIDSDAMGELIIVGDFNCDPFKGRFYRYLLDFVKNFKLSIADSMLPIDSFTYISAAHQSATSWLDHVLVSNNDSIENVNIRYGDTIVDHIPVSFHLLIPIYSVSRPDDVIINTNIIRSFVQWDKVTDDDVMLYDVDLEILLSNYINEAFLCSNINCTVQQHRDNLDQASSYLIDCIKNSSRHLKSLDSCDKFKQVPGWNDHVKSHFLVARDKFLVWKNNGKIRSGKYYDEMVESRSIFKKALKYCKNNELNIKKEKLATSYNKNKTQFWRKVKEIKNNVNSSNHISCIDKLSDPKDIVNRFNNIYKEILNDPLCRTKPNNINYECNPIGDNKLKEKIYIYQVKNAINKLSIGIGHDGVHSNHLKIGDGTVCLFLSRLYSSFMSHGYVPKNLLKGEIRPIIKNKLNSKNDSNNYRPVMNSSNIFKVFEYCLQGRLEKYLRLNSRQFGFRKHTSCNMANLVLKETVNTYHTAKTNVHAAFLDLSKAFDKVNHAVLIDKLSNAGMSDVFVRLYKNILNNQYVYVVFNDIVGELWKIENGVRQGGINSPLLFNFYINDILNAISELNVGCNLSYYRINIIGYADDLALIAPSGKGLQIMINVVVFMLTKLCLSLNVSKSVTMIFKAKKFKKYPLKPTIHINGTDLKIVNEFQYLGTIISDNGLIGKDIERCTSSFLKQFHSIFRKFYFTNWDVLKFLFESHATSFYGCELWYDLQGSKREFHALEVHYHRAIKKMLGLPGWESNHYACAIAELPIFKHFIHRRTISFLFNVIRSESPCIAPLRSYYMHRSEILHVIKFNCRELYDIENVLVNDFDAIKARISFVQAREKSVWGGF